MGFAKGFAEFWGYRHEDHGQGLTLHTHIIKTLTSPASLPCSTRGRNRLTFTAISTEGEGEDPRSSHGC